MLRQAAMNGDSATARWYLSRKRPEEFGDRLAVEHTGAGGGPIQTGLTVEVNWHDPDPGANREPADVGEAPD